MRKLGWVAVGFGLGVLAPAVALVGFGFRALTEEEARRRAEQERAFEKSADLAAGRIIRVLRDREAVESKRPFFEYQYVYADPRALASNVVVGCSPLAFIPSDPLISGHVELRADGAITTPLLGPDIPNLEGPRDEPERRRGILDLAREELVPRLLPPAQKPIGAGPILWEETVEREYLDDYRRSGELASQILTARAGDPESQRQLVQSQQKNFDRAKGAAPAEVVRYHAIQYLSAGPDALYAYRLVEIGRECRYQGYRIDLRELRESAIPTVLASLGTENLLATVHAAGDAPTGSIVRRLDEPPLGLDLAFRERDTRWIPRRLAGLRGGLWAASGALLVMLVAGFVVIGRLVRSEVDLARRKSDFVSAVSHELKTPLSAIRMYGELLEEGWVKDRETERAYFSTITRESERLSRLIDNVLDYARIEQHRKEFRFEEGDLGDTVRKTCEVLRPHAEALGFALRVHTDADLPTRPFDTDALAQVLVNLVDNALKFSGAADRKEIEVFARRDDDRVRIEVRDHGPGIPAGERERVFEQFYRIGNDVTRETGGVGLGLSLVRGFVRAHGGSVEIVDSDGAGACVRVTI